MRFPDYRAAFAEAGLHILWEEPELAGPKQLDALRKLDLAERFRSYPFDDLAVVRLRLAAVPSPDALVERENIVD
jgi:hypothetical protein